MRRVVLGLLLLVGSACSSDWPDQAVIEDFCFDWNAERGGVTETGLSVEQCIDNAINTRNAGCSWPTWHQDPHLSGRRAHYPGCDDGSNL